MALRERARDDRAEKGTPVGRRVVLGHARPRRGRGARPAGGCRTAITTVASKDPTGLTVAAAGRRGIPLLLRRLVRPAGVAGAVPPDRRRPGRPAHDADVRGPAGAAADPSDQGLPVRHRVAGARRALVRRGAARPARPRRRALLGGCRALHVDGRRLHRVPARWTRRCAATSWSRPRWSAARSPRSTAARCASTSRRCTATSRASGWAASRSPTTSSPGYWEDLGYDVDAWVGQSNGRSDAPTS